MIKIKKVLLVVAITLLSSSLTQAQIGYFEDALRFSQYNASGSARVMGLGGTQMSLGGDVSNIHGNPAGLGFFQKSEFSISPSYTNWRNETNFLGQVQGQNEGNLSVPNISLVIASPRDPLTTGAFRGGTFGLSYNRMNYFNNQFGYFSNIRNENSLLDFYINQYSSLGEPPIGAPDGLPLDIELIQGDQSTGFIKDPDYALGNPQTDETIVNEGRISQTTVSYGANFYNKLFIGGGLGLTSINFFQNRIYGEDFEDEFGIRSLNYSIEDNFRTNGFGVNLNIGLIYKPLETINLGLNFQSPTWFRMNNEFDANIIGDFYDENGNLEFTESSQSDFYINTTTLRTPMRISGGASFFVGKSGFISADIDFLDYSTNTLNSNDFNTGADNQEIRRLYGQTINFRVGGEYRFDIWRVRGGYGFYGDPFVGGNFNRTTQQFTGGVGVRLRKFYVDFALVNRRFDDLNRSYTLIEGGEDRSPTTNITNNLTSGIMTVGFTF